MSSDHEAEAGAGIEPQQTTAVDDQLIDELVTRAQVEGLQLTGEGGLLQQLTKRLLESALEAIEKQESAGGTGTHQAMPSGQHLLPASNWPQAQTPTLEGTVKRWDAALGRGFIATNTSHGDHYVDRRFVVGGADLQEGRVVRFIPLPALQEGKLPLAGCAVQEGHHVQGHFQRVFPDKGFAFVSVVDSRGNQQSLFVHLGPEAASQRSGAPVALEVCQNSRGIAGQFTTDDPDCGHDEAA